MTSRCSQSTRTRKRPVSAVLSNASHPSELKPRKRRTLLTLKHRQSLRTPPQDDHDDEFGTNVGATIGHQLSRVSRQSITSAPCNYTTLSRPSIPRQTTPTHMNQLIGLATPGVSPTPTSGIPPMLSASVIGIEIRFTPTTVNPDSPSHPSTEYLSEQPGVSLSSETVSTANQMRTQNIRTMENHVGGFDAEYQRWQQVSRKMGQHGLLGLIAARNMRRCWMGSLEA